MTPLCIPYNVTTTGQHYALTNDLEAYCAYNLIFQELPSIS